MIRKGTTNVIFIVENYIYYFSHKEQIIRKEPYNAGLDELINSTIKRICSDLGNKVFARNKLIVYTDRARDGFHLFGIYNLVLGIGLERSSFDEFRPKITEVQYNEYASHDLGSKDSYAVK